MRIPIRSTMDDLEVETGRLRPDIRPLLVAGVANILVAALLLGVPFYRGPDRAREIPPRFAAFAACLYASEPLDDPGLGLPRGERARYASLVVGAPADWPGRCRDELAAIAPPESRFLFPRVKDAEAQLRQAVALVDGELEAVIVARAAGSVAVSDRPMRALARLRGALAELGLATDIEALRADRDAIRLAPAPYDLAASSIVPVGVSLEDDWGVAVVDGELVAGAMDERTIAHVRVSANGIEQRVTRRRGLVGALLGAREPPWVVFRTPAVQCAEDRCASRATGLAAFVEDRQTMEPMVWIGGHAAGDPRGALHIPSPGTAWMVAVAEEGTEVRRFALPETRVRALGETIEIPRVRAEASWPLPPEAHEPFAWIDGDPPSLVASLGGGRVGVLRLGDGAVPLEAFEVPPGIPRVAVCGGWIAVGTERGIAVRAPDGTSHEIGVALRPPLPGALQLRCDAEGSDLLALGDGRVSRIPCDPAGCAEPQPVVEGGVHRFAVAVLGDATLVAWTGAADGPVRLVRVAADGPPTDSVPAPCWSEPTEGLCGEPRLASDGRVAFLATRSDRDLRVVMTEDGIAWRALPGLEQP